MKLSLTGAARPVLTLIVGGIVLAACVIGSMRYLDVSTDQNQLFSSKVGFFKDFLEFNKKFPENEAAYVVIEAVDSNHAPSIQRWTDAADAIAAGLRADSEHVTRVDERVPLDQLASQALLFQDPDLLMSDLKDAQLLIPLARLWGEKPKGLSAVVLSGPPMSRFLSGLLASRAAYDSQTKTFAGLLAGGWETTLSDLKTPVALGKQVPNLETINAADPQSLGYYYVPDESDPAHQRKLLLIKVYPKERFDSLTAVSEVVAGIRSTVKARAAQFPEFKVGLTGRPVLDADENETTDRDSRKSEIVALSAIFIGLVVMLRSLWMALAAEIALAVAIGWTFGWATVSRGELNLLSTVFLIALIGIGMDYLVQLLVRYRYESTRHARSLVTWAAVFRHVGPPINTACLGAACAFLASVLTDFRGAADLGIIAGGGLLLCLLAGYTVLPAMLTLLPPKVRKPQAPRDENGVMSRAGIASLWSPAAWVLLLILGIPLMRRAHFDPNLLNLQAPNLESVKLVNKLQTWSAVVLTPDLDMLRKMRESLKGLPQVKGTDSILRAYDNEATLASSANKLATINWMPPATVTADDLQLFSERATLLANRLAKTDKAQSATMPAVSSASTQATLRHISAMIQSASPETRDIMAARLTTWQQIFVEELKSLTEKLHPGALDLPALPAGLREHYVSKDGLYALYIDPAQDLWNQENLESFERGVEQRIATVPNSPAVTGITSDIYHSTASIRHSFYIAAGYALGIIVLLVLIDLRRIGQTLLAVSVLGLGLPMLVAAMGFLGYSWNFANFFGLPILIGAGHEYGVFMVHRYREARHDTRRAWRGWDTSDRALLLCAYVTSTSFGFFWLMGHHAGLKSLGMVMALGTACIYLAATFVLRPVLRWNLNRFETSKKRVGNPPAVQSPALYESQV